MVTTLENQTENNVAATGQQQLQFSYLGDGGVSQNVIRGGWFLNPRWLELSQL